MRLTGKLWQAAVFTALGAASLCAQGSFTLEQVMSSPFPTELVAAPAGGNLAWVFNALGARNLWVAEPAAGGSYHSRQLTAYTGDDGQDIAELAWAPDGRSIVYARGGDFEGNPVYPNPASASAGVEQDVWIAPLTGGAPRKLAEGHSPAVSPKGDEVVYIFKDQVWLVKLAESAKPEQLIHDKGRSGSLRWSPDGARLAFVSRRGDHSLVVVYALADKSLRLYLDFVLKTFRVEGSLFRRVGRSALRPGPVPRACEVDRPPALFSQAEENLRPLEPVFASSTGEGSGSGSRNRSLTPGGRHGQAGFFGN